MKDAQIVAYTAQTPSTTVPNAEPTISSSLAQRTHVLMIVLITTMPTQQPTALLAFLLAVSALRSITVCLAYPNHPSSSMATASLPALSTTIQLH